MGSHSGSFWPTSETAPTKSGTCHLVIRRQKTLSETTRCWTDTMTTNHVFVFKTQLGKTLIKSKDPCWTSTPTRLPLKLQSTPRLMQCIVHHRMYRGENPGAAKRGCSYLQGTKNFCGIYIFQTVLTTKPETIHNPIGGCPSWKSPPKSSPPWCGLGLVLIIRIWIRFVQNGVGGWWWMVKIYHNYPKQ